MPPVVGVIRWVLQIPDCSSLKQKRAVIRSIRDRMASRYRISVAETGFQDDRRRSELCAAVVTSDRGLADSLLERLDRTVSGDPRVYVLEREANVS
ncbi:MAG: DUF503 domain-containing protein [Gemmatimonadota bacterium]